MNTHTTGAAIVMIAALSYTIRLSAIDQLGIDDLLGLVLAGVHEAHPRHLIGGLQLVRGTGVLSQGGQKLLHSGESGVLDLQAVVEELFGKYQLVVVDGIVLLEEGLAEAAVAAQGTVSVVAGDVRDQVITAALVVQFHSVSPFHSSNRDLVNLDLVLVRRWSGAGADGYVKMKSHHLKYRSQVALLTCT